eukprot:2024070-Alexandrium_andersonii.AAC.1
MSASLVGSEMCIRDRALLEQTQACPDMFGVELVSAWQSCKDVGAPRECCLLYTSDAADDM